MKKISLLRVIAAVAVLTPAISANAALFNYNEQFDNNGVHFNLNFTANDTGTTVITNFNGTADTDALTLIAPGGFPGGFDENDNLFDPTTLATAGGWNFNGVSAHGTDSGYDFNFYFDNAVNSLLLLTNMPQAIDTLTNYSYSASPVSSVPVPAAFWLFASGLGLLTVGRRKKMA